MKRGSIFRKLLLYMLCTSVLTAGLTVAVYVFTGATVFAERIADEMLPRAYGLAGIASRYQTGQLTYDSFINIALREQSGLNTYIFDSYGNLIAYEADKPLVDGAGEMMPYAYRVLETGEKLTVADRQTVIVGVPIRDNMQRVSGAILLSKPAVMLRQAMNTLLKTLLISCLAVALLMVFPVYLISRRMSDPIRRMTDVANAMAGGDFSVSADERGTDEIGQLGHALNFLSARLDTNIRDLKLARNRLHTILDGLDEGVAALDGSFHLVYRNPAALLMFDCTDSFTLMERLSPMRESILRVTESREPHTEIMDAGEKKLMLMTSFSQESSSAAPGAVVVIRDVTAEERLEQTRRDYVANVSHELRTPIASIRSLAETLDDGLIKSEEDRARYYGYILRESMRLSRLINDLLELSRLQSGAIALEKRAFSAEELFSEVVERMRVTASSSGISLELDNSLPEGARFDSNRDRIEQVLVALLDNAIKFASDDGVIRIEAVSADDRALVSVKNTGAISEKDLPHLFERFYKADASHSDGGTGLGLAIVSEILTLLGERIEVMNEAGFVVFRFTVRLADADTKRLA